MSDDFRVVTEFYASRGGRVAARLLRRQLGVMWPDLARLNVLGLGHAQPFLSLWQHDAALCVAAETRLPADTQHLASATCIVDEHELPFPDLSFDRILLSHALETSTSAPRLLRMVWRLLKDDGRLMLMVPNRRGLWAHRESTPFGQGEPWSRGQIDRLLKQSLFRTERSSGALWMPPADLRPVLRLGRATERTGARLAPHLSGVLLIEAVKDVYAAMPTARRALRRVLVQAA